MRGRPANQLNPTRRRVLTYWRKHGPCPLAQVSRATGVERSRLYRIIHALDKMGKIASPINSHIPESQQIA